MESIENAAASHPTISQISADIDLAGREEVIDELLGASVPNRHEQWLKTREAWRTLYGGEAPRDLIDLMADAAADLRERLQRSEVLRPLWSALSLEQVSNQIVAVDQKLDAVFDPAAAIRFRGPDLARSPAAAIHVAGALAEQLARGAPGKLIGLEAVGADGSVRIRPQPGVDLEVTVTKLVPNTPEGRAELERLSAAMASGEPIDMGEVNIQTRLGGQAVQLFPETGHLSAGPATRTLHVVLTISSAASGIEERVVLTCDGQRRGDTLHLRARSSNRSLLRADIELHLPTRRAKFRFYLAEEGELQLRDQVNMHRALAAFAAGGVLEMYIVEFNLNSRTEFGSQSDFATAAAALPGLELLAEVGAMLRVEVGPIESFTEADVALLRWARQLLTTGEVQLARGAGELTLRGTKGMWDELRRGASPEGKIDIRYRAEAWPLGLIDRTLTLGPVWHTVRGAQLPRAPRHEGRLTAVDVTWDETAIATVSRVDPGNAGEPQGLEPVRPPNVG